MSIIPALTAHEETPPQLIGEFKPVDDWQAHINALFYGLRGGRVQDYYQTMASADYRLAHALAVDFHDHTTKQPNLPPTLVIQEWGCGNGNLAACFLTHLKALDSAGAIYRRTRYVLVDANRDALQAAVAHPDLQSHREQVTTLQADAQDLAGVKDGSVHWIHCNELWNELRTKVILRKEGDIIEEQVRPNLSDAKTKEVDDWSAFVRAFEAKDIALEPQQEFLSRMLGVNVLTGVDLLATHPSLGRPKPWEQDRLLLQTLKALDGGYRSPYHRAIDFPIRAEMPDPQKRELQTLLESLPPTGVPDTIAYLSEEEVLGVLPSLEALGFERALVQAILGAAPRRDIDYYRFSFLQK